MLRTFAQKTDTACFCYSVFCDLDVPDRSCVARKERVFFCGDRFLDNQGRYHRIQIQKTSRYFTLCQVLNLWSATYT